MNENTSILNFDNRKSLVRRFLKKKEALFGVFVLFVLFSLALFVPMFSSYSYDDVNLANKNLPPSISHFFGTDDLGRDLFTRVFFGARISLSIGILAAILDVLIGIIWGSIAAFAGGKTEEGMMRFVDLLYSLPYLLIVILFSLVLGSGFLSILAAMTILGWVSMARIVQGQVAKLKKQDYVLASITMGAKFPHILKNHLIPNCIGPIIVTLMTTIPSAIFIEAFLSFLGLGIQAPISSWGNMAYDGLSAFSYYPWRLFFPAFFISATMLCFNLVGDGLTESFELRENMI